MAFFLLGRGPEDELHLLAPALLATRQDALAELTRITSEPSFAGWDSEVFVVDFETAMPVLLVRPAAAAVEAAAEPEIKPAVALVDVAEFEAASDIVGDERSLEESAVVVEAPFEVFAEPVVEEEVAEPVGDEAIADAISEEASEELAAEAEGVTLRDALLRTTEHMESTGIVAPESIGPAEEIAAEIELPAVLAVEVEVAEVEVPEPAADEQPVAAAEPEVAMPEVGIEQEAVPAGAAATSAAETGEAPAWPWDLSLPEEAGVVVVTAPEPAPVAETPFVLDALEEPAIDDASILRGAVDDEELAASRPVILGAYEEMAPAAVETSPAEAVDPVAEVSEPMGVAEPMSVPESPASTEISPAVAEFLPAEPSTSSVPEMPAAESAAENPQRDDISDFIFDLGGVTGVPEADDMTAAPVAEVALEPVAVSAPEPVESPLQNYTCDDCVYVETCPNKDQRLPKDCGSFQWK